MSDTFDASSFKFDDENEQTFDASSFRFDDESEPTFDASSFKFDDEVSEPVEAAAAPAPQYGAGSEIEKNAQEMARIQRVADWNRRGIIGEGRKHLGRQEDGSDAFEYDAEHAPAFAPQDDEGRAVHERVKAFKGGNLGHFNRPMKIDRDEKTGKATGYGTARTTVVEELDGTWSVIPTIWRDKRDGATLEAIDDQDARIHYREDGGERFGNFATKEEAEDAAKDIHDLHQRAYKAKWNQWINEHWDEVDDRVKNAPGVQEAHAAWEKAGKPGIRFTMKVDDREAAQGEAKDWQESAPRKPMGILEHGAKSLQALTGKEYGEGEAALLNVAPFGRQVAGYEANRRVAALEKARSGNYQDGEIEKVAKALGVWDEVRPSYTVDKDEARRVLSGIAEGELKEIVRNKEAAQDEMEARPLSNWGKAVASTIENSGYVNSFIYGSMLIPVAGPSGSMWSAFAKEGWKPGLQWIGQSALKSVAGSLPASVAGGLERASGLANKRYEIGEGDELIAIDDNYSTLMSAFKGMAGSTVENMVVEGLTDEAINLGLLGAAKLFLRAPGALDFIRGASKGLIKSGTGRALIRLGRVYNALSQFTQFDSIPGEQLEEIIQPIFDDVAGLGKRKGEKTDTFGEYAGKMFTSQNQVDILLGLVGTMLVQGGAAGAHVLAERFSAEGRKAVRDAREARAILVEAGADKKMVGALSDEEAVSTAEAYRAMLKTPKLAEDFAKKLDDRRGEIFGQIAGAQEAKMNGELADLGIAPKTFTIPLKEGKSGVVPDFKDQIVVNPATGETFQGRMVVDAESGVRIIDNGAGNHENAYTVFDPMTGKSFGVDTLAMAKRMADILVGEQQLYKARDQIKIDAINKEWGEKYPDAKMFAARTVGDAVAFSQEHGVDIASEKGFNTARAGWKLPDGTVVLVRDNIKTPYQLRALLRHENIGHSEEMMQGPWLDAGGEIGALRERNMRMYGDKEDKGRILRESVANIVQKRLHNPTAGEKISHALREGLRKVGIGLKMNDADLEVAAAKVEKAMREGRGGELDMSPILRTAVDIEEITKDERTDERGTDEAPAESEQAAGREAGEEEARPAEEARAGGEAPDAGVVEAPILSGDEVRKTMPGYDPKNWRTHVDKSGYVAPRMEAAFQRLLKERKGQGNGEVVMLAGGNGSGKSTVAHGAAAEADFIIDSTLGNLAVAKKQIDAILANGQKPRIVFVYRSPEQALDGVLNRVKRGGHVVSPLSFADSHVKGRQNLRLLSDEYGDKISIKIFDNSVEGAPRITLEQLEAKGVPDHAELRARANEVLGGYDGGLGRQVGARGADEGGARGESGQGRAEARVEARSGVSEGETGNVPSERAEAPEVPSRASGEAAEAERDAMRDDAELKRIDAAYKAAKTDAERNTLKEAFKARVEALRGAGAKHEAPAKEKAKKAGASLDPETATPEDVANVMAERWNQLHAKDKSPQTVKPSQFAKTAEMLLKNVREKNADALIETVANGLNPASLRAFEALTGIKMPRTQRDQHIEIDKYCGITPEVRAKMEAERKADAEAKVEAKRRANALAEGERIAKETRVKLKTGEVTTAQKLLEAGWTIKKAKRGAVTSLHLVAPDDSGYFRIDGKAFEYMNDFIAKRGKPAPKPKAEAPQVKPTESKNRILTDEEVESSIGKEPSVTDEKAWDEWYYKSLLVKNKHTAEHDMGDGSKVEVSHVRNANGENLYERYVVNEEESPVYTTGGVESEKMPFLVNWLGVDPNDTRIEKLATEFMAKRGNPGEMTSLDNRKGKQPRNRTDGHAWDIDEAGPQFENFKDAHEFGNLPEVKKIVDEFKANSEGKKKPNAEAPAPEPPKTAPVSAPQKEGATTPPKSTDAPQGAESASGGTPAKPSKRPQAYLDWLNKWRMKDTDRHFAEWQKKQGASSPKAENQATPTEADYKDWLKRFNLPDTKIRRENWFNQFSEDKSVRSDALDYVRTMERWNSEDFGSPISDRAKTTTNKTAKNAPQKTGATTTMKDVDYRLYNSKEDAQLAFDRMIGLNAPVSAPPKAEATTPPKAEKPVEGQKSALEEPDPSMVEKIFANTTFQGGGRKAKIKAIVDTWRQMRGMVRPGEKVDITEIYDKIGSRDAVDRALSYPDPFIGKRWDGRQEYGDNDFGRFKVTRPQEELQKPAPVRESRTTEKPPKTQKTVETIEKIKEDVASIFDSTGSSAGIADAFRQSRFKNVFETEEYRRWRDLAQRGDMRMASWLRQEVIDSVAEAFARENPQKFEPTSLAHTTTPRQPSIKMKDAAGEKALDEALDALFDTPELAPARNEYRAFDVLLPGGEIKRTHGYTRKQAAAYAAKNYPGSEVFDQGGAKNAIIMRHGQEASNRLGLARSLYPDATRKAGVGFDAAIRRGLNRSRTASEARAALNEIGRGWLADGRRGLAKDAARAREAGWEYYSDGTVAIPVFDGTPNKASWALLGVLLHNEAFEDSYEITGFFEDGGTIYAVAKGPRVVVRAEPSAEARKALLIRNGFKNLGQNRGKTIWSKGAGRVIVAEEDIRFGKTKDGSYVPLAAPLSSTSPLMPGVSFDMPEFDQEAFNRRVAATSKVVDVLQKNGYNTFQDLATVVSERRPEVFENIKPFLQDIWNAVARARNLSRVDDATAEKIFGIIEAQGKEAQDDRRGIRGEVSQGESAAGGRVGVGLAEGQPAGGRGQRESGGLLAGGRVREQDTDERVDSQRSGAIPGQPAGVADQGAREEGAESGGGTAEGTVAGGDRVRSERGERDAGQHPHGTGDADAGQRGEDRVSAGGKRVAKAAKKAADETKANPFRRDFVMTKAVEEAIREKSPISRIRQNLAAITLIRELAKKDFVATPDEQATLAKYVGWGGLSEMFCWDYGRAWDMERNGAAKGEVDKTARRGKYGLAGYEAYRELRQTLNDAEYESARASTTTAFYTPIEFVRALHDALRELGVEGGRFLGPSAGTGNFASAAGEYEKPANWQFVEKDQVTGMILKALFPNQRVNISGFEETKFPDGFFDFAIDNVPYADVSIADRSLSPHSFKIHDYFFAKTLAKLRPGGVMAFLTSTGTLDKTSPMLRHFLTEHGGKIVGAVRLPNGFFAENAGTDVASDLVIVQKVEGRPDNSAFEKQEVYKYENGSYNRKTGGYDQKPVGYNGYFKDHPEQVVGKMEVGSGPYGPTLKYAMPREGMMDKVREAIRGALGGLDKGALMKSATVAAPEERAPVYDDEGLRQGNITIKDGKAYIKSGEMLEMITLPNDWTLSKELIKRKRTGKQIVEGLVGLRKAMRDVIDAQMRGVDDEGVKPLLATLNEVYDTFVKKNGALHDRWITPFVMLDKADGNRMLALERTVKGADGKSQIAKSDIFTKRVISRGQKATKAGSPKEALIISYSETGGINIPRIANLLDMTGEEAIDALKKSGDVFENPQTGRFETSWEYLSGRVRAKLAAARAAVEAGEEAYRANVAALEKVQPPMVKLEDTEIKFGATWVDTECMKDFLKDAFGSEYMRITLGKNELTGQWNVSFDRVMDAAPWGETSWSAQDFVSRVLNHGSMEHWDLDPVDKKRYLNEKRTEANKLAAEKLHSAFSQFIRSSDKWAGPMYERYNAVMTDNVGIKLPNNILPFRAAGMSEEALRMLFEDGDTSKPKKGREYQSDVIARGVLGGNSLCLAHCVGAGKTLEMQAIGMLGRRIGMFKKSMYVVPNHMLDQFVNEFTRAFPDANILKMTADDVKPANRRAFFAQVANGDWDAIVVKHSTFSKKLGMSKEYQEAFMNQQKKDLIAAIGAMKEAGERISVKQGEKMLARLEEKLKKLANDEGKDKEIVPFEELGVDQLFVDEAHNFKGMPITTRQGRTGGLQQGDSERAEDMHMKTQYVQSLHGGTRGVVFATGTPLSNAPVVEAYVILKYLAPQKLAEQGLSHFDDFVDAFGRITTETEFREDGKTTKEKDKVSAFVNIPDFMKLFKSVVDIVNSDQLDIPRPKPKYHMIDVEMTDAQRRIMEAVAHEALRPANKDWPSKYMDLTWVAKLACISPRMIGLEDGGNKILRAVAEVKKVYDETASERGTQLIFTDRFEVGYQKAAKRVLKGLAEDVENGSPTFNLNNEIKELLVRSGIPADEIAIIQDIDKSKGDKDANKEALFAKVRAGEVRVLIGSRPKMGEGTNVQERLAAIHLLHPGWKPSEDEQAIGRIIRNGNMFQEGQIFYYLTKGNENIGSYETKNHQLIGVKSRLIDQVMHSDDSVRAIEMDDSAMDRDMLMGLASGNKALIELIDVKKRVHKLELNTDSTLMSARRNKDKAEVNSRVLERKREAFAQEQEGVKEWREKNGGKPFALTTPDGRTIEKVKDMAEYVAGEMAKQLTKGRYDRDESTVIGNVNGVDVVLTYDRWGDEKFKIAVPLLGVEREINYSGFVPDFSTGAMTAFKNRVVEAVSPDFAKAQEEAFKDLAKQAKKMSADADKLQKDYEQMRGELVKLRTRQAELERAVTPLVVQAVKDRSVAAYGNWWVAKNKSGEGYMAEREKDWKRLSAPTVKELIPLMDAEDFANPKNAANKTGDLRTKLKPNSKGEMPSVNTLTVGQVDFMSPDLDADEFNVVRMSVAPFNNVDGAVEWARDNGVIGKMSPSETGGKGEIDISANSVREMLNPNQVAKSASKAAHFAAVTKLRDIIRESHIEEAHPDFKKGPDGKRSPENGINPGVFIGVAYAAVDFDGLPMRAKITLKKFVDKNTPTRAYAYHVAQIEVLTGNLANPMNGTGPQANTSIHRNIILNGVLDVNGVPLLSRGAGGVNFDTPELSPAEAEYAEAADKTPTEKVMREVYGMTNDEIATAMRAAGMEPPPHARKSDETTWKQAETLLSNTSYMEKLAHAVAKFPRPITDYENIALNTLFRQRKAVVEDAQSEVDDWQQTLDSIGDDNTEKKTDAQKELSAAYQRLREAKSLMHEAGKAAWLGASEQGRALRSNRFLLDAYDYSYAGITATVADALGGADKVTPEMDARIKEIAQEFAQLDEKSREAATARLKAQSEKIISDIKNKGRLRKATERKIGDEGKRALRNYMDALAQIEVGATEVGGTLIGLADQQYPSWGRWLRAVGEYHCFMNPAITEEDMVNAIVEDISPFLDGVDANQVRNALTGYGHNYKLSRYDSQRLMNDLRAQSLEKVKQREMREKGTLPLATGPQRDEPSDTLRAERKTTYEMKKEIPDEARDARHLKGLLDSAKTRIKNRIADMERAIETGEKIPAAQRKVVEDIELRDLKKRKAELQAVYDDMFKTARGMTEEQRIAATEKALSRELEMSIEDLARAQAGDFSKRAKRPGVTSPTIDVLRAKVAETRAQILELKRAKYAYGMTPEEIAARNARKLANRDKALARLVERVAKGDLRPQAKPQPPMTKDEQKRYDEMGEKMKRARQALADLRLEAENATAPTFVRKGAEYLRFASTAQRALRATMDFSAVLRQSLRLTLAHPVMGAKAFGKAWEAAHSEANLVAVNDEIMSDPAVQEAVEKYGLHLREVEATNARDVEMFHGMERNKVRIFGKEVAITDIPFVGKFMLKSERHYITYLNAMSAELYSAIVNDKTRFPSGATAWQKKMVADMINIWNGSAALSKERRQALQKAWVNDIFWAPQLAISRVQSAALYDVFRPIFAKGVKNAETGGYDAVSTEERKTAFKIGASEHIKSSLARIAIGALLRWLFADDDDKYEFSKANWFEKMMMLVSPRIGNTTIDLTGGEQSVYRAGYKIWQLATSGEVRTNSGKTAKMGSYGGPTVWGAIGRYLQGKTSPWVSEVVSLLEGRDYVGNDYTLKNAVMGAVVPLSFEDIYDQLEQNGVGKSLLTIPLTLLGAGGSTYDRKPYENAVNRFLEAKKEYDTIHHDELLGEQDRSALLDNIHASNPLMSDAVREDIASDIKQIRKAEARVRKDEKLGHEPDADLLAEIESQKAALMDKIRRARR